MAGSQTVSSQWLSFMGGLANENDRKRGEKEEEGRTARRTERGQGYFSTPNPPTCGFAKEAGQMHNLTVFD